MQLVKPGRIQAHRVFGGTDYGPCQHLLVDAPDARLMWVGGHTTYCGRMLGNKYSKATLWLVRDEMSIAKRVVLEITGKRLSQQLLESQPVQDAVTAMWGEAVADALAVDVTVVLGPSETEAARRQAARTDVVGEVSNA